MINAHVHGEICTLTGVSRENTLGIHDIMHTGHYEKSLLRNNDLLSSLHKMKIISLNCIVQLCRLSIAERLFIICVCMENL